ncbi:bacillithiol system redox-active protein YtxJ [Namhaeicola litoreus]|uniref:Bacillithiol system redox-active protein YtxJ n=1 Tax=Namhaeicola litoreus TaxID=1052145 RepID=A0ABW3Y428_9FLAO
MNLRPTFFSNKADKHNNLLKWKKLEDVEELDKLATTALNQKIIIFKHSPRCGISSAVLRRFEAKLMDKGNNDLVFLVNVLSDRELSKVLADKFKITHQSPQVLIIKNEKLLRHASHYDILDLDID